MPAKRHDDPQERATYLTLISIFGALGGAFSLVARRRGDDVRVGPLDFFLLGLATFRAGRLVAGDKVLEPLRAPFVATKEGGNPGEEEVEARGRGARRAIGELLSCSTCAGTWVAAFLVYGLRVAPTPTRALLLILAATGMAEITEKSVGALSLIAEARDREAGGGE